MRIIRLPSLILFLIALCLSACNTTFVAVSNNGAFFLAVSSNSLMVPQGGLPMPLSVTVDGAPSSSSFLVVIGMPMGVTVQIAQPNSSGASTVTFQAASTAALGSYLVQILCTSGSVSTSKSITLLVVVSTSISAAAVTPVGFDAQLATLRPLFPFSSVAPPAVLAATVSDPSLQVFATRYPDSSFVIMLHDIGTSSEPRTVFVDVSALGHFSKASQFSLQSSDDLDIAPRPMSLSPTPQLSVTLQGSNTVFLHLNP